MTNIDKEYAIALAEVGTLQPNVDPDTGAWVVSHPAYDLEGHGNSPEEAIATYKSWLYEFIEERLKGNLAPNIEARTTGRGGRREGSGRPKGEVETQTVRIMKPLATQLKGNPALQVKVLHWIESQSVG